MAFATKDDVANQWRALSAAEGAAAESHLDSVAVLIRTAFLDDLGLGDVPDDKVAAAKTVSIEIVKTALSTGRWPGHISYSTTRTEGPRSKADAGTFAKPGGSLELSDWHRTLLGLPVGAQPVWSFPTGDY